MGHLSTSDRVTTKLTNGCVNASAAENTNGSVNGSATLIKRSVNGDIGNTKVLSTSEQCAAVNGFPTENGKKLSETAKKALFPAAYPHNIDLEEYTRNFKGDRVLWWQFKAPLKWDKVIQITLLHIAGLIGLVLYPLDKLNLYTTLFAFFMGGVAGFGVTAGAHRFWTHRSYKANLPLRIILMCCFSASGQNTLYDWVRDHRVHHKYSETDADPHNANRGFFFAHVGWLMMLKHPEVLRRGRQIDMSDILADPVVQFHQKYFIALKTMLCFVIPMAIPIYFWGEHWYLAALTQCIFRYVSSLNFTWSVNSAAHMWGTRPYDKRIMPSENIYVSIIAMGEGWHNYHHVFPWDYKAAELGQKINLTTKLLDFCQRIGWAWDMKQPSHDLVRRTLEKYGDGSHASLRNHHQADTHNGHCHMAEVPDPELEGDGNLTDEAESSSTESSKLDENDNIKEKIAA